MSVPILEEKLNKICCKLFSHFSIKVATVSSTVPYTFLCPTKVPPLSDFREYLKSLSIVMLKHCSMLIISQCL